MPIYKEENSETWYVQFGYTDWNGAYRTMKKRGFKTKKEAVRWESEARLSVNGNTEMAFEVFVNTQYLPYISKRVKESTMQTKMNIVNKHILPYFRKRKIGEIDTKDIIKWHDIILETIDEKTGRKYKPVYLKTIHNQLTAIFNYAVRFYGLSKNPAALVGNLGSDTDVNTNCWSIEQMKRFSTKSSSFGLCAVTPMPPRRCALYSATGWRLTYRANSPKPASFKSSMPSSMPLARSSVRWASEPRVTSSPPSSRYRRSRGRSGRVRPIFCRSSLVVMTSILASAAPRPDLRIMNFITWLPPVSGSVRTFTLPGHSI